MTTLALIAVLSLGTIDDINKMLWICPPKAKVCLAKLCNRDGDSVVCRRAVVKQADANKQTVYQKLHDKLSGVKDGGI